ncbi:hypothetical protein GOQ29_01540 [Clostridium sp. D2Q-14]|uniref:hypothetical protein n=1 Tax=Anaeromonas gelatinilytica TaxID=2683194 RepID=UPI00193C3571|nr:hypothetical protein [Anaeromonas gelatinilytica]MBS4534295.1 hypothetical protein [Anaeromonas gelatinilytica]
MRKKFNLEIISDKLAEEMWGNIQEKFIIISGVILYECKDYKGIIFNNKDFNINKDFERKINPMILIEIYEYRGKEYVIERTNKKEKIPKKLESKFKNKKYNERISIFALTEEYVKLIKYYHKDILKNIYEKKIDIKSKKYKSLNGYTSNEKKEAIRYLALNAPEFIKSKDRKKAIKVLDEKLNKEIKDLEMRSENNNISKELLKDKYLQSKELIR